ncbi:uncharacterized protein LTHEOB_8441 [Neofusicoccum parvum]|uniref:Small secreted protein n=3 Tax=Neofusicoccum TaxID=407951 RepID=R1E7W8_BOTPV|nr:hypothetical protein UCRNP2_9787 [Neofusicoccum parvum UCRNP2]GME38555.1 uncharacterized protein LTHEOB_8441 [Neofusicoccum parvum]GME52403.1 uncharacterized protein LTHEOB_8441 [Neofusicoccum parvum]
MKFFSTAITTAVLGLFIASSAAAPAEALEARDDCVVNAKIISDWSEDGLRRYRIAFSTTKSGVDMKSAACTYWHQADPATNCASSSNNVACYHSTAEDSWVVDENEVAGPAGKSIVDCMVKNFITTFAGNTGCRAG